MICLYLYHCQEETNRLNVFSGFLKNLQFIIIFTILHNINKYYFVYKLFLFIFNLYKYIVNYLPENVK